MSSGGSFSVSIGDVVEDLDGNSSTAIVVNRPPVQVSDWEVHNRGCTVAEDNPDYPSDDRTVIVVFESSFEHYYPNFTGGRPIPIGTLNADGVDYYAFPDSRLQAVDSVGPLEVPLAKVDPSPYHSRNFDAAANREFIDAIAERGHPKDPPLVRDLGDRFEVVNGHKRIWASHVAGLEEIPVECLYYDDIDAAKRWAKYHLPGYGLESQMKALAKLEEQIGHRWHQIKRDHLSYDLTQPVCTGGDRDE